MAKQKTVSKTKEKGTGPKSGKKRRPKEQIDRVKKWVKCSQALRAP